MAVTAVIVIAVPPLDVGIPGLFRETMLEAAPPAVAACKNDFLGGSRFLHLARLEGNIIN